MAINFEGQFSYSLAPVFTLPEANNRFVLFMTLSSLSMPKLVSLDMQLIVADNVGDYRAYIWGLAIPDSVAAGNYAVDIDMQGTRSYGAVYSGVSPSDPIVDSAAALTNDRRGGTSLTLNCVEGGWAHDMLNHVANGSDFNRVGSGQTALYSNNTRPNHSYKSGLVLGTTNMSWWWDDTSDRFGHAAVSLRPAGGRVVAVMY